MLRNGFWLIGLIFCFGRIANAEAVVREQRVISGYAGPQDFFGASVAISGDTAVAGVPRGIGGAIVFKKTAVGWEEQAILDSPTTVSTAELGGAVAIDGDTIVLGAKHENISRGAAYVYVRSGSVWTQQAKLEHPQSATFSRLGSSVAISGDTILVGAPDATQTGSVFCFRRNGDSWVEQTPLQPLSTNSVRDFGTAVAIDGNRAVVGSPGNNPAGAIYIFERSGNTWTEVANFARSETLHVDRFGSSVALHGSTVIAGMPGDASLDDEFSGCAFVFALDGENWAEQARLSVSDAGAEAVFGTAVAIHGNTAAVGAPQPEAEGTGVAYIFSRSGTKWTQAAKISSSGSAIGDQFGATVAIGEVAAVFGAAEHDFEGAADQGAISFYEFSPEPPEWFEAHYDTGGTGDHQNLGWSVAISGSSAAIGAPLDNVGYGMGSGSIYVYTNVNGIWKEQAKLNSEQAADFPDEQMGERVAIDGDTIVASATYNTGQTHYPGAVYVFFRQDGQWSQQARIVPNDAVDRDLVGASVAVSGDTLAFGAPSQVQGGDDFLTGAVYVYVRSGGNWTLQQKLAINEIGARFGSSVALKGDVLVAGSQTTSKVYTFVRSGNTWTRQPELTVPAFSTQLGSSLSFDGTSLIAGAPSESTEASLRGAAYIFTRSGGWSAPQRIAPSIGSYVDDFGNTRTLNTFGDCCAIDGNRAIVAASARAFIFELQDDVWTEVAIVRSTSALADHPVAVSGSTYLRGFSMTQISDRGNQGAAYFMAIDYRRPPVIEAIEDKTAVEGETVEFTAQASDLDGNLLNFSLDPGAPAGAAISPEGLFSFTAADGPAVHAITVRVTEADVSASALSATTTFNITVSNVAPVLTISGAANVAEGAAYTITIGAPSDPGDDTISSGTIRWGDGTDENYSAPGDYQHIYSTSSATPRVISIDLIDEDGAHLAAGTLSVLVSDVAPVVALNGAANVDEGAVFTLDAGAIVDPGTESSVSALIYWGDGTSSAFSGAGPYEHTYADGAAGGTLRTISVDVTDGDGLHSAAGTVEVAVLNVAPTVSLNGDATTQAGYVYTLAAGAPIDPGADVVSSGAIFWGDGASSPYIGAFEYTHIYANAGTFEITVDLTDEDGNWTAAATKTVDVENNSGPAVVLTGADSADEGSAYTLTIAQPTGSGSESVTGGVIHWRDGQSVSFSAFGQFSHTYADGANPGIAFGITVDLVSQATVYKGAGLKNVTVQNVAPNAAISGSALATRGSPWVLTVGAPTDPGIDTITGGSIVWGDGQTTVFAGAGDYSHTYALNGVFQVRLDLQDEDGLHSNAGDTQVIVNAAPSFTSAPSATPPAAIVGEPIQFNCAVSDADGDTLTFEWNFGDGTTAATQQAQKAYNAPGTYVVIVTVSDSRGASIAGSVAVNVTALPLSITKLAIKLNFARPANDSIQASGALPLAANQQLEGANFTIDVGGVVKSFTLDSKGKAKLGNDSVTFAKPKSNITKFTVKLAKGDFAATLAFSGLVNDNIKARRLNVLVKALWFERGHQTNVPQTYTAKKGKSGASK